MIRKSKKDLDRNCPIPTKRQKYNAAGESLVFKAPGNTNSKGDDVWGEDFGDEDIEEMDLVASQVLLQDDSVIEKNKNVPSTSKGAPYRNDVGKRDFGLSAFSQRINVQQEGLINTSNISIMPTAHYEEFEKQLMSRRAYSSTFQIESNSPTIEELEKLKLENQKLRNNFVTKEGETAFLRNQLQQLQARIENERLENKRLIEQQANHHKAEINTMSKEKQSLITKMDIKTLEISNLIERCKILETGSIKLTEPHVVNEKHCMNRSKQNFNAKGQPFFDWASRKKDTSVQTSTNKKFDYTLKTQNSCRPLIGSLKEIHDPPYPEEPVAATKILENVTRRDLPILQEECALKVFANPELVKPAITMIDNRRLTTEFILREVVALVAKTDVELESENSIPLINKIVSTARELLLNLMPVLQTIRQTMTNDDIRDMNDMYFSNLYCDPHPAARSVCDANPWHDHERGVEARRVIGLLSYIAPVSLYLSKYIRGKIELLVERDKSYEQYSPKMARYNAWPKKGEKFEILEMFLEFVTLVGLVRRAHQFSGIICAILMTICNVHEKIGYCEKGMDLVLEIFREIVFSRPLPYCYILLCKMMTVFMKSMSHLQKLCVNSRSMAVKSWNNIIHFSTEACPLQIFLAQLESHRHDPITTIAITESLILLAQDILQRNVLPLRTDRLGSCCCLKLLRYTTKILYKTSAINLDTIEKLHETNPDRVIPNFTKKCLWQAQEDVTGINFWPMAKNKQIQVLCSGIRFLCHFITYDSDVVSLVPNIADSVHLFMQNIDNFDDVRVTQNEKEALSRIREILAVQRVVKPENDGYQKKFLINKLDIGTNFEEHTISSTRQISTKHGSHNKTLMAIKALFKQKS